MLLIGFVNDDVSMITLAFRNGAPDLAGLFTRGAVHDGAYYRPIVDLSFAIDYVLFGWHAWGYRLTNLLLHVLNVALVWQLGRRLIPSMPVAVVLGTAFFAVHPIHETSLYWIVGRTDVICTAFYLGSILLWLRWRRSGHLAARAGSLLLFMGALLSKEMALSLPLVIMLLGWWIDRDDPSVESTPRTVRRWTAPFADAMPFAALAVGLMLVRLAAFDNNMLALAHDPQGPLVPIEIVRNYIVFFGLLIIPTGHRQLAIQLSAHPHAVFIGAAIGLIAAIGILWTIRRALAPAVLFLGFIVLTILPASRLSMRWYLYLPSVGFCLGFGWLIARIASRRTTLLAGIGAGIIGFYTVISATTALEWTGASHLHARLLDDVARQAQLTGLDTISFATIPAKVGTTPVMNLGLPQALRHRLDRKDLNVVIYSRVEIPARGAQVQWQIADAMRMRVTEGSWFRLSVPSLLRHRAVAQEGAQYTDPRAAVRITMLDRNHMPIEVEITPTSMPTKNLFIFDGQRMVRVR